MPIYLVTDSSNGQPKQHLVSAKTPAGAIAVIRDPRYTARIASDAELIALTKQGVELVTAKDIEKAKAAE